MDRLTAQAQFEDTVPEGYECPECHEARVDWLLFNPPAIYDESEDVIECATCGYVYPIPEAA